MVLLSVPRDDDVRWVESAKRLALVRDLPLVYRIGGIGPETLDKIRETAVYGIVEQQGAEYVFIETLHAADKLFKARTANKRIEAELQSMYAHTPVIFALIDKDTGIQKVNDFTSIVTGFQREELIDTHIGYALHCIHHMHDPKGCGGLSCEKCELRALLLDTLHSGKNYYKKEITLQVFPPGPAASAAPADVVFEVSSARIQDGDDPAVFVTLEDITCRRRTEKQFHTIFNSVNDAIYLYTIGPNGTPGKFFEANQRAVDMLGYSREELLTMTPADIDDPESTGIVPNVLRDFQCRGSSTFEMVHTAKNGRCIPVEISATCFDLGGEKCVVSVARDLTEHKLIFQKINRDLHEKNVLLKEIHHRVKNNLSIVIGLLNLELDQIEDVKTAKDLLQASRERIYSMALIHEKLYESSDFSRIEMKEYVESLVRQLSAAYGRKNITLRLEIDEINLDIVSSIPCGLILNELITNSFLHGFTDNQPGIIRVMMRRVDGDKAEMIVGDNGTGLPEPFPINRSGSLGLKLVQLLTEQLGGSLRVEGKSGTEFAVTFPVQHI